MIVLVLKLVVWGALVPKEEKNYEMIKPKNLIFLKSVIEINL